MNRDEIVSRIRAFVVESFLYMRPEFVLGAEDSLLGSGVIDSMGVMEMIEFLEEEFGVIVDDRDITEENLGTLNAIAGYVAERRDQGERQPA